MSRAVSKTSVPDSQSTGEPLRVLMVEHSRPDAELCLRMLKNAGFQVRGDLVETREEFVERLGSGDYDIVLADYRLPQWTGIEALALLQKSGKDIPFLLVTGTLGEEAAVECIKQGVTEYVLKDRLARLPVAVHRALQEKALREARARAEQALRESEARYRELVKNATYGIYCTSPEGRFLDMNPALVAMLGYGSEEEVLSLNLVTDVYVNPVAPKRLLEQAAASGPIQGQEVEWKRKDGTPILVRLSGRLVRDAQGTMIYFEGIAEDVTERRGMERHLRQAQKFEAIGQLAGGVAHDFNNVISAILGWAELGMDQTPAESKLHTHFRKIREQADRAAALARQLLAFARRQILEPWDLNLNQAIADLLNLLEKVIGKDVELKAVLAPDLGVVRADPTQLEQVLMNLCLNARDAMPRGGQLLIETKNAEIDEEYCRRHTYTRPGRYVVLSVSDNGVGIDSATLEHIFEPFFTTKGPGKGTGLGLATVYGIVKQHGGFVHVYSELGHGATFSVYLPVSSGRPGKEVTKEKQPAEAARGGTETILVAEDHEGVRELARSALERLGYRVILASDGEEVVRMFEAHGNEIAMVLMDVVMPKLSGPEAYARMRAARPGLPVLFTTGYSSEAASLDALVQHGAAILQKPYRTAHLAHKVREVLDRADNAAA